jgi:hypothetical protein
LKPFQATDKSFSVTSFARGYFGFEQATWMAFFTYLDTSGSGLDPNVKAISVGGFIAHETQWAEFEKEWPATLARFGIKEFHMKDFAHSKGEFREWKDDKTRRDAFMEAITDVINRHTAHPVGATLPLDAFKWINQRYCFEEGLGAAYTTAVMMAIAAAVEWKDSRGHAEPMLFFIERGDNQQSDLRRFMRDRIKWDDPEYFAEPQFPRKRWTDLNGQVHYLYPFQAADLVSWEQAKALTDLIVKGKRDARKSMLKVVPQTADPRLWRLLDRVTLARLAHNRKTFRRYNFFAGKPPIEQWAITPLCYVNELPVKCVIGPDGFLEKSPSEFTGKYAQCSLEQDQTLVINDTTDQV